MPIKDFYFYILTRRIQVDRTFYAMGAMASHGVPLDKIVMHYGPECTEYETIEDMHAAFLKEYPEVTSNELYQELPAFGCFWGSFACIKRFLESEHGYCYFTQDDFVPIRNTIIEYPIAEIIHEFDVLVGYDPDFKIFVYVYRRLSKSPDPAAQIHKDIPIQKGLCGYGDSGLILSKAGAEYLYEKMKESAEYPEDILKKTINTPEGDSFYISLKGLERYGSYRHSFKQVHGFLNKAYEKQERNT